MLRLERSKVCHNEGITRSLKELIKRPLKGIISVRGVWWFTIHVPYMWHMARSPSVTLPGIICWSVPVTLPQVLWPLLLSSEIGLMPSNNQNLCLSVHLKIRLFQIVCRLFSICILNSHDFWHVIIIITLFQEDNIFGTNASLTYGPQIQRHACIW